MFSWIWLAIGLIFFYFSFVFLQYSKTPIRSFSTREGQKTLLNGGTNTDELRKFKVLLRDFDQYLDSINTKYENRARIATIGFFLAGLASFITAYIS